MKKQKTNFECQNGNGNAEWRRRAFDIPIPIPILYSTFVLFLLLVACGGGKSPPAPPPCDQTCKDQVAARALREMMKLAYNLTLQGKPVGMQDASSPCPLGGTVHVFGTASSNAVQGATNVDLTYAFDHCHYMQKDTDPTQAYDMTLTTTATEKGTIAVQPSSTTALQIASDSVTFSGTVYDAPIDYEENACMVTLGQSGNQISGTMCGRDVGLTL
jgi:hypothetical protein